MSVASRKPNSALVLAALLCVNPAALLIVGLQPTTAILCSLAAVVLTQALWYLSGPTLATVYTVNFLGVAGVWINAEAVVRARYHEYVMEDLYEQHGWYYTNRPNLRSRLTDKEYTVDYLTNREGYRIGYSQDVERSVTEVDWLFLGDSYTQGAQVAFEELYTTKLYRRFPDRIVLNVGISGWGLYEELAFLKARGPTLRPKVVFLQIANFNDFMKVSPRRAGVSDYLMQKSELVRLLLQNHKYTNPTNLPLGRWVEPFYASDEDNRRFNVFYRRTSPDKERDLAEVVTVLTEFARTCQQLGARLVLIQIPTKEQVSFRYLEEAVAGLRIEPRLLDMDYPNRVVQRIADSLNVSLVDPLSVWRNAPLFPFFHYDEHLTAEGHGMLADAVAQVLRAKGEESLIRILSTSYSGDRYPQFVGRGDTMVFHSPRDGNSELLEADIETWTERRITTDDVNETHPIVLPNGGGLVFVTGNADDGTTKIWRSARDGSRPQPLEAENQYFASIPAAFPTGDALIFPMWGPRPDSRRTTLTLLRLRDGQRESLPQATPNVWRPVVHPSGQFIAYIGEVDGQYDLFELNLITRETRRLTATPHDEWDPSYTPNGDAIVYAARPDGNWDLLMMVRTGSTATRLTRTRGDEWDPQVSPDGQILAYGGEYGLMRGIYAMPFTHGGNGVR